MLNIAAGELTIILLIVGGLVAGVGFLLWLFNRGAGRQPRP